MNSTDLETAALAARTQTFSALGDPIRLAILDQLGGDLRCVCELQEALDIAPNLLSYHLRVLRESGLVESARRGRWVDYRLTDSAAETIAAALPTLLRETER